MAVKYWFLSVNKSFAWHVTIKPEFIIRWKLARKVKKATPRLNTKNSVLGEGKRASFNPTLPGEGRKEGNLHCRGW